MQLIEDRCIMACLPSNMGKLGWDIIGITGVYRF